jgi:hypothetical protein
MKETFQVIEEMKRAKTIDEYGVAGAVGFAQGSAVKASLTGKN